MSENFIKRTNDIENALVNACATDAGGGELYEEIKELQGQLYVCRCWLNLNPDAKAQQEITRILNEIEDFIVNHLSGEE